MTDKIIQSLRLIDLLADVPEPLLARLAHYCMIRQVRAGETIFCQTEPSPYCFGIVSGQVTIQRVPRERHFPPKVLSTLSPGMLFGEQALFEDSPRTASAIASQQGELIAIQGKKFRDWIEKDWTQGLPFVMGILQNTMSRLRQTSHELSLVYGVGRFLAAGKPLKECFLQTCDFLRASLEHVDEVAIYQRNLYWDEFEPLVSTPEEGHLGTLSADHPLIRQVSSLLRPIVPEVKERKAAALIPLLDQKDDRSPLQGFIWAASHSHINAFQPSTLVLLDAVSIQITESLLRHSFQEEQAAKARLIQGRQTYNA